MLLLVAGVNVVIVMAVCWHMQLPVIYYGWMSALVLYCVVRISVWHRLLAKPIPPAKIPFIIKANIGMTLAAMSLMSFIVSITYALGTFERQPLIPVTLAFGAMAIAHCFYTLKPAAIGVLILGITPVASALLLYGAFDAAMIGVSMLSVAVLMIRFVAEQNDRLLSGLFLEQQIRELADTDPLTGLPNRRAIMASIEAELAATDSRFGIALLDLDGFKQVNDSLGHHAGDLMLLGVSGRLTDAAGDADVVGRLGGDEFIILLRDVEHKAALSVRTTALLANLCRPIELDGHRLPVAASLGFAMYPEDGQSIREVLHIADTALYAEKRAGKSAVASKRQHAA